MRNCTLKTVIYLKELDIYRKLFQDEKNNKDKISWLNFKLSVFFILMPVFLSKQVFF
ncbi:hypothetical protein [Mycoplasmopsis felis]|uniref:hypothetical protein n=1 Tax=Mycoplasmopsis felis TaxID=33923 RepID=UPI002B000C55|nr:hypothetical protein [Mycoplasmopsis felis]WQQ07823.1 hypothetical protein RRG57_00440 [Mycoplasmopsis felis]